MSTRSATTPMSPCSPSRSRARIGSFLSLGGLPASEIDETILCRTDEPTRGDLVGVDGAGSREKHVLGDVLGELSVTTAPVYEAVHIDNVFVVHRSEGRTPRVVAGGGPLLQVECRLGNRSLSVITYFNERSTPRPSKTLPFGSSWISGRSGRPLSVLPCVILSSPRSRRLHHHGMIDGVSRVILCLHVGRVDT